MHLDSNDSGAGAECPRILVVTSDAPPVTRLPELFRRLLDAGVELVFAQPGDGVPPELAAHPRTSVAELPLARTGETTEAVELFRAAADVARFLHPGLARARWPRRRTIRRLLKLARQGGASGRADAWADIGLEERTAVDLGSAFGTLERLLPPEAALVDAVAAIRPDAVLLVTRLALGGVDPDVLKVARVLGIRSLGLIWSWDNLSSKAAWHEHPDRLLVWNELQAREATVLHGVPAEHVAVVGAANFDRVFAEVERAPAAQGERGGAATILYLGSSKKVAPREPEIFERWLAAVRACADERVARARVTVRPHPGALDKWDAWTCADERVAVSMPRSKTESDAVAGLLRAADAVVALNTSAQIDAAIAGRPVVTFRAPGAAQGQETLHFEYLLEANGGFVVDSRDLDDHVAQLGRVLRGDYNAGAMRRAVERFVRPAGIDRPVVPLLADAILEAAGMRSGGLAAAAR